MTTIGPMCPIRHYAQLSSMNFKLKDLATDIANDKRKAGRLPSDRCFPEYFVSRDARRGQRRLGRAWRRTDRV